MKNSNEREITFASGYVAIKSIRDVHGVSYQSFRNGLIPNYLIIWLQITGAYAILLVTVICLVATASLPYWLQIVAAIPGAVVIGSAIAFINLWLHEAAHFNLHPNQRLNDILTRLFICPLVGNDIKTYRPVHMLHHKYLGTTKDPEQSYFNPLTLKFLFETLTGLHVLVVLKSYKKASNRRSKKSVFSAMMTFISLSIHFSIFVIAFYFGAYGLAGAWCVGAFSIYPFFGSLRQLLEHRRPDIDNSIDYSTESHGAYTRTFGGGLLSSIIGGAGFNRHLIHHWDPTLSCTNFKEAEIFFLNSEASKLYKTTMTTYYGAIRILASSDRNMGVL